MKLLAAIICVPLAGIFLWTATFLFGFVQLMPSDAPGRMADQMVIAVLSLFLFGGFVLSAGGAAYFTHAHFRRPT